MRRSYPRLSFFYLQLHQPWRSRWSTTLDSFKRPETVRSPLCIVSLHHSRLLKAARHTLCEMEANNLARSDRPYARHILCLRRRAQILATRRPRISFRTFNPSRNPRSSPVVDEDNACGTRRRACRPFQEPRTRRASGISGRGGRYFSLALVRVSLPAMNRFTDIVS